MLHFFLPINYSIDAKLIKMLQQNLSRNIESQAVTFLYGFYQSSSKPHTQSFFEVVSRRGGKGRGQCMSLVF